ncbi:cupin domain-containing protein [Bradyrhizobium sp. CCBAU 45389]|uniref:cupin domain-containing protein n=1 Tax=Bradyrhizobium sp. CCBAU 45389 TaxID=858429 RepID=UPI002306B5E2|nr:cupin domain-containing protein [Bradyrhizobium sp. CCBAU 45389]
MSSFLWRLWQRHKKNSRDNAEPASDGAESSSEQFEGRDRRHLLQALSVLATGSALTGISHPAEARDSSDLPPPRRALTGRDEAGKSVLASFDATPKVVEIDANPGLTFYELYMTEGVPELTGREPDPMLKGTKAFPGPGGTMFRLISYPPKRPEGWKPPPGVTFESGLREMSEKIPGMGDHFERGAPGMHTSDTIDYGVVVRGEMTLELDDGQKVHLRQGDCIVQNGTRHRWRNPLPEPCLMAFISVGGKRA